MDLPTTNSRSTQTDLDTDPLTGHIPSLLASQIASPQASHRQYGAHIASSTSFSATKRRPTSEKEYYDLAKAYIELANLVKEYFELANLTKDHLELVQDYLLAMTSRRDSTQQLDSIRRPSSPRSQGWLPRGIGQQDVIKPSQKPQMPGGFPQDAPSSRGLSTDGGSSPPTMTLSAIGALRSKRDQETLIKAESRDEPTHDDDGADHGSVVDEKPEESEEDVVVTKQHTSAGTKCAALTKEKNQRCKRPPCEGHDLCSQHEQMLLQKNKVERVPSHPPTQPQMTQVNSNPLFAVPVSQTARPDQHDGDGIQSPPPPDHGANKAGSSTVRGQGRKGGSALASVDDDGDSGTVAAAGRPSHEEAQMAVLERMRAYGAKQGGVSSDGV